MTHQPYSARDLEIHTILVGLREQLKKQEASVALPAEGSVLIDLMMTRANIDLLTALVDMLFPNWKL